MVKLILPALTEATSPLFRPMAYRDFYRWGGILRGASTKPTLRGALRHAAYAAGWKKFEPLWDLLIRLKRAGNALPVLERVLDEGPREPKVSPGGYPSTAQCP
ncbi:MAG: hypothetical protein ACHP85_02790 [Burkholderiales bacterium]